jgi:uncharacterized protein (DUF362 family)
MVLKMMMSKVVVVECDSYEQEIVNSCLEEAIAMFGDIKDIIGKSSRILLKPNLLAPAHPDQCVTTHPSVIGAAAHVLRTNGYQNLSYGDSPANANFTLAAHMCRVSKVAMKMGLKAADFENGDDVEFPEGKVCKKFHLARAVQESDCIISISKLKTHQLTGMTGAVKNQFGCISRGKSSYHRLFKNRYEFCQMLVDLNLLVKPKLYVMDAVYSMEGNGPYAGTPINTNAILVSDDPIALDYVACRLINLRDKYVPFLSIGMERGLGFYGKDVEIITKKDFTLIQKKKFKKAKTGLSQMLSNSFLRNFDFYRKVPVIDPRLCIGCKKCAEICPAPCKAIKFQDINSQPMIQYKDCIKCYCCHEICPQKAINLKYFMK